jgi:hypothetical protein
VRVIARVTLSGERVDFLRCFFDRLASEWNELLREREHRGTVVDWKSRAESQLRKKERAMTGSTAATKFPTDHVRQTQFSAGPLRPCDSETRYCCVFQDNTVTMHVSQSPESGMRATSIVNPLQRGDDWRFCPTGQSRWFAAQINTSIG